MAVGDGVEGAGEQAEFFAGGGRGGVHGRSIRRPRLDAHKSSLIGDLRRLLRNRPSSLASRPRVSDCSGVPDALAAHGRPPATRRASIRPGSGLVAAASPPETFTPSGPPFAEARFFVHGRRLRGEASVSIAYHLGLGGVGQAHRGGRGWQDFARSRLMATAAQGAQRVLWALLVATLGGAAHAAEPSQTVDALVVQLKSEAKQVPLERASETSDAPQFAMPHRTLPRSRSARPELAEEAARALLRFNGDQLGDRYVRFHLLGAMADGLKSKSGPPHDAVAPEVGRAAAQVLSLDRAAEHLRGDFEIDTYREPKDVFERWDNLEDDLSIAVGVPPFQRWVKGEAAMRVASPRQRERLEAVMAERAQLERRLAPNYTKDRAADARNERRKRLNWLLRDQRATAAEILISYGDAKVLASTISSAVQAAEGGQQAGFDVLDAMVRQLAEGRADLSRFGRPDLEAIARPLERASRGAGRWSYPKEGETPLQWARSTRRNVADLAASLDLYFRYPAISASLAQGSGATPRMALPQRASSSSFSLDAIERSVATARPVINDVFGRGEAVERMRVELRPVRYNQLLNRNSWAQRQREIGTQAALAWAMIGAGQPSQSPGLQHRVHVALAGDTPRTFDLAMRVLMTARLPGSVYEPLLRRQVDALLNGMSQQGGWGKTVHDDAGWGDHAHAMYVAYALDAADRAGLSIPRDVWVAIDRHWRATQESTPGDSPAGWRVLGAPFGKEPANATVDAVSVAPTA
ncbi:MAG: hypothetical protein AAGB29_06110, partial [Planctomycetota bacterium]